MLFHPTQLTVSAAMNPYCRYKSVLLLRFRIAATNPYCCYEVQVMEYIHAEKDDNIDCRGV